MLVQLGFFFHMRQVVGDAQLVLTRPLLFTICFMLCFSIVIALFKDIPDVKGDLQVALVTKARGGALLLTPHYQDCSAMA